MKNLQKKIAFIFIGLCCIGLFYSFNQKKKSDSKRYEIIRTIDGTVTIYDTVIPSDSKFTPNDFLRSLGFENDKEIKIIDLNKESFFYRIDSRSESTNGKEIHSNVDIRVMNIDNLSEIDELMENSGVKVIKHSFSSENDLKGLDSNIDSLIKNLTSSISHDSVFIKKIIISDSVVHSDCEKSIEKIKILSSKGFNDKEHHISIDTDNEIPNLTLVIVSDADESTKNIKKSILNQTSNLDISVYPNPAQQSAKINLELSSPAETTIQIVDLKGALLQEINLGEIVGRHTKEIDLSDLAKGTYIVNIQTGKERFSQKLVVE